MSSYDYIIVGGGLAGSVVASRLHEKLPAASILLLEAGEDQVNHPFTAEPMKGVLCHGSELDWNFSTVPQRSLGDRICYQAAGKALGGSTAINYGTWTRGPKVDYDRWATLVNDEKWSYDGLSSYFPKSKTRNALEESAPAGKNVIFTATPSESHPERKYPLRNPVLQAWESKGVDLIADANNGYPLGISERVENWDQGRRQHAHRVFGLDGVQVLTGSQVGRILVKCDEKGESVAYGVELVGGEQFSATKEVIISAGAYNSPKILLLSGIGPGDKLQELGIEQIVELSEVGRNFHDHIAVPIAWKLKTPDLNRSFGELMNHPIYRLGWASDWVVFSGLEENTVRNAVEKDNIDLRDPSNRSLLNLETVFTETLNFYVPAGTATAEMDTPMDGMYISSTVLGMSPTSRGSISISSKDPLAPPIIDPNYYSTEMDRTAIRTAVRKALEVYQESDALKDIIECEAPPQGYKPLQVGATDEEIDDRVKRVGITFFHPAGSCSMGKVVDTELKVYGVKGLRVVDASVLPSPIAAHLQIALYALGARAADLIVGKNEGWKA